tara:strand:+ start:2682 stop:7490 length:4809 start_codon:yes stop_codon:yes gene_type:complete
MAGSKKISRNFIKGRMNKMVDERLVPNGEYIDAVNVRLGSTENAEIGSVENSKGNSKISNIVCGIFNIANSSSEPPQWAEKPLSAAAVCVGSFADEANETVYWFIHDNDQPTFPLGRVDLIVSFNVPTNTFNYHATSVQSQTNVTQTTLNFDPTYHIYNIDKVGDLLFWTDNYNPPRVLNVNNIFDGPETLEYNFDDVWAEEQINVVKAPPLTSPRLSFINTNTEDEFLQERFICFAYRYRYVNNEYSATSQFTLPAFVPAPFEVSAEDYLNSGMVNTINAVVITYNTGPRWVIGVDLLFKEATSNTIKVIESVDKQEQGLQDNIESSFTFTDSKIFTILSSGEILRLYDNVPRLAKTQTLMGNRLMYGNYTEGYNLIERSGNPLRLNYQTSLVSKVVQTVEASFYNSGATADYNLPGGFNPLPTGVGAFWNTEEIETNFKSGAVLSIEFTLGHNTWQNNTGGGAQPDGTNGGVQIGWNYVLPQDYTDLFQLFTSAEFQNAVGTTANIQPMAIADTGGTLTDIMNAAFSSQIGSTPYYKANSGITGLSTPATIVSSFTTDGSGNTVKGFLLKPVGVVYQNSLTTPTVAWNEFYTISGFKASITLTGNPLSLHSNRGYEVGIVYMDEYNRSSTALVSPHNTVSTPCGSSVTQNKIKVTIPPTQIAPFWAKQFKFVIKPDEAGYNTIYVTTYFIDPSEGHTYFLLEGENIQKVEEGDRYIVKKDSGGAVTNCRYGTVLEKKAQSGNFIDPLDDEGNSIPVTAGVYMKMKANGFETQLGDNPTIFPGSRSNTACSTGNQNDYYSTLNYNGFDIGYNVTTNLYTNATIPAGSTLRFKYDFSRQGGSGCSQRSYNVDFTVTAHETYDDIIQFWNTQDLGALASAGASQGLSFAYLPALADETNLNTLLTGDLGQARGIWFRHSVTDEIKFVTKGTLSCNILFGGDNGCSKTTGLFQIVRSAGSIIFETEPTDALPDIWYESDDTYQCATGYHVSPYGGDVNQTSTVNGEFTLSNANCFTFGNGVESMKIRDSIKGKDFNLGNRVTSVSEQDYKEALRFADITYSGLYNQETNLNRLNEFNLGLANFKPLEASFGAVNKMFARETDVLVLQEDKISYVLSSKNLLSDASGGGALTSIPEVLGTQVARVENYGISDNGESFTAYGSEKFFTDGKRGAVIRLSGASGPNEQLTVISEQGMRGWFRDLFIADFYTQKLGGYDPYMNEYVLHSNEQLQPSEYPCIPCGATQSIMVDQGEVVNFCVELGNQVGTVTLSVSNEPNFSGAGCESGNNFQTDLTYVWNSISTTQNLSMIGGSVGFQFTEFTFDKTLPEPTKVDVTLTGIICTQNIRIQVSCPVGQELKIKSITLTNNGDSDKFIHSEFYWNQGTFTSPINSSFVNFVGGLNTPLVSAFNNFTGFEGGGFFPPDGGTVVMRSNKIPPTDNFEVINSTAKFRWLRTSINYENNASDITNLLAAIAAGGATNSLIPTGSDPIHTASFTMPTTNDLYLYLVWDYRPAKESLLCYGGSSNDVCCLPCVCGAGETTQYTITNSSASLNVVFSYTNTSGVVTTTTLTVGQQTIICVQAGAASPDFTASPTGATFTSIITDCAC